LHYTRRDRFGAHTTEAIPLTIYEGGNIANRARIIERGNGWAVEVEIAGKVGYIGKAFQGVTIYPTFNAAQAAAVERGYLVVNQQEGEVAS